MTRVITRILRGFDDETFERGSWEELLTAGDIDVVFLTWHWQRCWWECFGRERLLLVTAEREGRVIALAPLFAQDGLVFFVGSGASDYLDFIGDVGDPEVLDAILGAARDEVPNFRGFRFYHVLDSSRTGHRVEQAAGRLGLVCCSGGEFPAPALDLAGRPDVALSAVSRKSILKHERFFCRGGALRVRHFRDGAEILPHLGAFFEQHIARRAATPHQSAFLNGKHRAFAENLARVAVETGWLRFTRVDWQDRAIAFHFGFSYRGSYYYSTPSFAIDLAHHSPGQVLLRQVVLAAIQEGAANFDFGLGNEAYKLRYATHSGGVRTWGLYPPELAARLSDLSAW